MNHIYGEDGSMNLPQIAADLAAHLDSLPGCWLELEADKYLGPFDLSEDEERTVLSTAWDLLAIAWGMECVDCGDVRDFYFVHDSVWKQAGLDPHQCCCRKCLSARLGRPLERADFKPGGLNAITRRD